MNCRFCSGEIYYIGGHNEFFYEIKDALSKVVANSPKDIYVPKFLLIPVTFAYEAAGRLTKKTFVLNKDRVLDLIQKNWGITLEKAKRELGYAPAFNIYDGLTETFNWYRKNNLL